MEGVNNNMSPFLLDFGRVKLPGKKQDWRVSGVLYQWNSNSCFGGKKGQLLHPKTILFFTWIHSFKHGYFIYVKVKTVSWVMFSRDPPKAVVHWTTLLCLRTHACLDMVIRHVPGFARSRHEGNLELLTWFGRKISLQGFINGYNISHIFWTIYIYIIWYDMYIYI